MSTIPGISDHDAIVADSNIKPAYVKKAPRTIFLFSKADWSNMRADTRKFAAELLGSYATTCVEENWTSLKLFISQSMASYIPSKTTSGRHNLPWLSSETKRWCRKKHRMYRKAKKSESPAAMVAFKTFKKDTTKKLKRARSIYMYVNKFVTQAFEGQNTKQFWKFVKSQRQNSFGIPPLKKDGKLHVDSKVKAEIMLEEFKSVFTKRTSLIFQAFMAQHIPVYPTCTSARKV